MVEVVNSGLNSILELDLLSPLLYDNTLSNILRDLNINCSYISEQDFCLKINSFNHEIFSTLSINLASLPSKYTDLSLLLGIINSKDVKLDIILLQETWLTSTNLESFHFPGYTLYNKIRESHRGGGVSIIVNFFKKN